MSGDFDFLLSVKLLGSFGVFDSSRRGRSPDFLELRDEEREECEVIEERRRVKGGFVGLEVSFSEGVEVQLGNREY